MSSTDTTYPRLRCPTPNHTRYEYLSKIHAKSKQPRYFFAVDLYQCVSLLPRLLGSIVETIRFLGPESCALSIVEGRSTDGTLEVLESLRRPIEGLGGQYFLTTSDTNPVAEGVDRVQALAELRNQALRPLTEHPQRYGTDTTVLFINDVALCMEDILELIHQKAYQQADMTCAMDWINDGSIFYDVWVSRGINGDLFFEIPQSASWDFSKNLFWNDPNTKARFQAKLPFQVFSCWNGATAITAEPLIEGKIKFRRAGEEECYLGEPTLFCKDLWQLGHNKIAVVPSVNVGYSDDESRKAKDKQGTVAEWIANEEERGDEVLIDWKSSPPGQIKCVPTWERPTWVAWNE